MGLFQKIKDLADQVAKAIKEIDQAQSWGRDVPRRVNTAATPSSTINPELARVLKAQAELFERERLCKERPKHNIGDRERLTTNEQSAEVEQIYIMVNSSMPGFCKIGKTNRDPGSRAAEISSTTGVPTPFIVVWSESVPDCSEAERQIHQRLSNVRVNDKREFFTLEPQKAIQIVSEICKSLHVK